ncbi:DUF2268 domain-containing putative Zn-dependent protease [Spirosoma sordidisoli]|uniref:DUF2268 domain-containing protein n=1 Tax=Spirosoma sordidisoli TaxID=2502893 RepID=A0A4Q2UMY8_9BACT|nr:DUF2268 domain-containing putative Zn-dependent protease [Spirosoma sordidisoli]RYC70162.1 hypothetical protein EQG79_09855 [Spirosoma sordidisoli]
MRRFVAFLFLNIQLTTLAQSVKTSNPDSITFNLQDVRNFWTAYDLLATASSQADSLAVINNQYLAKASRGLELYRDMSGSNAGSFLEVIRRHPALLRSIRSNTLAISTKQRPIVDGARKLKAIYPGSVFPELFFCVGKFEVAGNRTNDILYIGTELTCLSNDSPLDEIANPYLKAGVMRFDKLDAVCLHEIVHFQQQLSPKNNLELALVEGGAEFITHYLTGKSTMQAVFDQMNPTLEKAIQSEFTLQAGKPIEARWFLAMGDAQRKRPGMLGYVVGFRLCENYYRKARNKQEALRNITTLSNPQTILKANGY